MKKKKLVAPGGRKPVQINPRRKSRSEMKTGKSLRGLVDRNTKKILFLKKEKLVIYGR